LRDLKQTAPDRVLHGGDLVAHGSRAHEVAALMHSLGWPGVVGNTDEMLWRPEAGDVIFAQPKRAALRKVIFEEMAPFTRTQLLPEDIAWLQTQPEQVRQDDFVLLHASPGDLWRSPLHNASDDELVATYGVLKADLVVYAHIHHPFVRRCGEFTVANTGAVSLSYDGDWRASYLLIEGSTVSHRRVEFDRDAEEKAIRESGTPRADWLVKLMRSGEFSVPF
jgi:predicted phosphodiesterase